MALTPLMLEPVVYGRDGGVIRSSFGSAQGRSRTWTALSLPGTRLGVFCECRAEILEGLLHLACALICVRLLPSPA